MDLHAVLDAISDAILLHDGPTGALVDLNAAACALWGRSREEILAGDLGDLGALEPPFGRTEVLEVFARVRRDGPQVCRCQLSRPDGSRAWIEMCTSLAGGGGAERFFTTLRDISLRKAAEDQLRASESTFRGILDGVHEEICVQDADGRLLDVNRAAERLFGVRREELLGRSPAEFAAPGINDFQRMHEAVRQTFAGHPQLFEFWFRHRDGAVFPREVSVTPGVHFGRPAAIAVLRDISERKQIEAERERAARVLRESEERFRLLLGRVPTVAVQGYTADATVRYWNEASERLYGYTAAEALGRNLLDLIIPAPMRREVREAIRAMAETGRPVPAGELELQRKDGSPVSVFSSHAVVRTAGSSPELYCLDVDLTERKRAERERLDLQQRLARTDKLESLAVLAGGVAHDFNNLLTAVLGNLDLARLELAPDSPVLGSIHSAQAAARAAAELARQMLAFSGRSRMLLSRIDLSLFVRQQVAELRAEIPPAVECVLQTEAGLPLVAADADQLRQTVHNLVRNAVEAVQDVSGARVEVFTREVVADATLLGDSRTERKPAPGRFVALEVRDNGSGMVEETQRRMFEPFFTTRFAGRGLGLAVVMGVVRAHRGAILVDSRVGHGTSVRVLLPVEPVETPAGDATQELPTPPPGHAHPSAPASETGRPARPLALLIDDDPFVRLVFTRMAPLIGLDLIAAETAEDAVRIFQPRAMEFSVIILDLTLPGMSGWECHDVLRALRPDIPVIVSSGMTADASAREFSGRHVAGVLPKPFTIEGLQQVLDAVGIRVRP